MNARIAIVFTLRDGRLWLGEVFLDPSDALRHAGVDGERLDNADAG